MGDNPDRMQLGPMPLAPKTDNPLADVFRNMVGLYQQGNAQQETVPITGTDPGAVAPTPGVGPTGVPAGVAPEVQEAATTAVHGEPMAVQPGLENLASATGGRSPEDIQAIMDQWGVTPEVIEALRTNSVANMGLGQAIGLAGVALNSPELAFAMQQQDANQQIQSARTLMGIQNAILSSGAQRNYYQELLTRSDMAEEKDRRRLAQVIVEGGGAYATPEEIKDPQLFAEYATREGKAVEVRSKQQQWYDQNYNELVKQAADGADVSEVAGRQMAEMGFDDSMIEVTQNSLAQVKGNYDKNQGLVNEQVAMRTSLMGQQQTNLQQEFQHYQSLMRTNKRVAINNSMALQMKYRTDLVQTMATTAATAAGLRDRGMDTAAREMELGVLEYQRFLTDYDEHLARTQRGMEELESTMTSRANEVFETTLDMAVSKGKLPAGLMNIEAATPQAEFREFLLAYPNHPRAQVFWKQFVRDYQVALQAFGMTRDESVMYLRQLAASGELATMVGGGTYQIPPQATANLPQPAAQGE